MKYRKGLALLLTVCLLGLGGCGNSVAGDEEGELPQIVVGGDDYPPFHYNDDNGQATGIDVDLATEAFRRMGYQAVFRRIDWEEKNDLLESGEIDCIWSSFTMTGREDEYRWAGPYMISRQVVAVNPGSEITQLSDLEDKVVAVQSTTKPEQLLLDPAGGIPHVREIYSLENRELLYTSLGKGYVDAIAAHEISIRQYMRDYNVEYRILSESLMDVGLGVAFARDDDSGLEAELTEILRGMREDGTAEEIISRYLADAAEFLEVEDLED